MAVLRAPRAEERRQGLRKGENVHFQKHAEVLELRRT